MKNRLLISGAVTSAVLLIVGGLVWLNLYTVVADVRENFSAVDVSDSYAHGEILFQTRGCASCHTYTPAGSDGDEGPSLDDIATRADEAYIRESIVMPNAVIATHCPEEACEANVMPNYGNILDDAQVDAIIVYLTTQP
ncbi:MAG: cytochrome c [Chloroflexota bacterium]